MLTIELLTLFAFISLLLGQFGKIPIFPDNFNLYILDIAVLLLVSVTSLFLLVSGRLKKVFVDSVVILGWVFIFWSLLTFIYNLQWWGEPKSLLGFSYWARFLVYFSVYFSLKQIGIIEGEKFRRWLIRLLIGVGVGLAVIGFFQLLLLPDLSDLAKIQGYDPHKNRLVSTFFDPNFTGAFLVLTLNLVLSRFVFKSLRDYLVTILLLVALVFTFSRSAWLMLAVSVLFLGLLRSRIFLLTALIIAFMAYFLVPRVQTRVSGITDPDDSARLRLISWQRAFAIAKNNPVFGVGFNNFRLAQEEYGFFDYNIPEGGRAGAGSDSSLLLILATTGIPGLLLYLAFYFLMLLKSLRGTIAGNKTSLAVFISLTGLLFESSFVNALFYTPILLWLFTAVSLL